MKKPFWSRGVAGSIKPGAWIASLLAVTACATLPVDPPDLGPSQTSAAIVAADVQSDFDQWLDWTRATHPDLGYTTDLTALEAKAVAVRAELASADQLHEAWSIMATVNPLFADAHTGLRLPQAGFDAFVSAGGYGFPAPVEVKDGGVFVTESIAATSGLRAGDRVVAINGLRTEAFVDWAMLRLRGEDCAIRERILSLRFALAFWTYAGGFERYEVDVIGADKKTRTLVLGPDLGEVAESAATYSIEFRDSTAILNVTSFERSQEAAFQSFAEQAFQEIADTGSDRLIIDLRQNGGGAHDVSDHLMAYLTDAPHSATSEVLARITPENQALVPGSTLGDVMRLPFKQTVTPPADLADRFDGEVLIWIGPNTYSQAIAFTAAAQDHDLARLVGMPTSGRANQTGQTQRETLGATGFQAQSPIYVFTRASGDRSAGPLQPDLVFEGKDVDALLELLD